MSNNLDKETSKGEEEPLFWRDKRLCERLSFALDNDTLYKDVHFLLGKHEIKMSAHKLILRLSSLVFQNIITAHEEQGRNEIKLPNTSPEMFRKLLKVCKKYIIIITK